MGPRRDPAGGASLLGAFLSDSILGNVSILVLLLLASRLALARPAGICVAVAASHRHPAVSRLRDRPSGRRCGGAGGRSPGRVGAGSSLDLATLPFVGVTTYLDFLRPCCATSRLAGARRTTSPSRVGRRGPRPAATVADAGVPAGGGDRRSPHRGGVASPRAPARLRGQRRRHPPPRAAALGALPRPDRSCPRPCWPTGDAAGASCCPCSAGCPTPFLPLVAVAGVLLPVAGGRPQVADDGLEAAGGRRPASLTARARPAPARRRRVHPAHARRSRSRPAGGGGRRRPRAAPSGVSGPRKAQSMAKRMKNMWMFVTPGIQRPSSGSMDGRPMRPTKLVQKVPADATRPATVVPRVVFWSRSGAPGTLPTGPYRCSAR